MRGNVVERYRPSLPIPRYTFSHSDWRYFEDRYAIRFCDLDSPIAQSVYVEIDHYEEKDYTEVDNKIERLGLKPRDRAVLDCYMAGMTCNEIAEFLDISRITVWRRRTRAQVKYKALFF